MPQNWFDYGKCHYLPHIWCQNIFTTEYNAKTWIDYDIFFSLFLSLSPWCPNLIALHCTVILFLLPPLFPAGHEGFSSDPPPLHLFAWQDNHLDDIYLLAGQQSARWHLFACWPARRQSARWHAVMQAELMEVTPVKVNWDEGETRHWWKQDIKTSKLLISRSIQKSAWYWHQGESRHTTESHALEIFSDQSRTLW